MNKNLTRTSGTVYPGHIPVHCASALVTGLYNQYRADVLRLCLTYLHNRPDAEDATQETFLKIWRKLDGFEGRNQCSIRSWIMQIACNTCRDLLRKSWRKHEDRSVPAEDLPLCDKAPRENIELRMDVMDLPEKYRDVVLLVYWQRMTIRETAEAVSASEATVCRRLHTARSMIGA